MWSIIVCCDCQIGKFGNVLLFSLTGLIFFSKKKCNYFKVICIVSIGIHLQNVMVSKILDPLTLHTDTTEMSVYI